MISHSSSLMKDMFTLENAICLIIIALLLTIVIRKCKKDKRENFQDIMGSPLNPNVVQEEDMRMNNDPSSEEDYSYLGE